jgi:hypothetical protein
MLGLEAAQAALLRSREETSVANNLK